MAGFLPGIFICLVLCVVAHFLCKKQGFEPSERAATEEKVQAFKDAILALLMPVIGSSMDAMEFVVEKQLKSLLLDEDPTKIEFLHQKMMWNNWANGRQGMVMGAISGIDVALWDILGKVANLPVCKLLGQVSDKVQGYAAAFLIAMHLHFFHIYENNSAKCSKYVSNVS